MKRLTSERENDIRQRLVIQLYGVNAVNEYKKQVEELISEIDALRDDVSYLRGNIGLLYLNETKLYIRINKLMEAIQKHPHDSYSQDYYGVECNLCKVLQDAEINKT